MAPNLFFLLTSATFLFHAALIGGARRPINHHPSMQEPLHDTLQLAVQIHAMASTIDTSFFTATEKAAWSVCVELSQSTVRHLNRSSVVVSGADDVRTWLSAAKADQEACRDGFEEMAGELWRRMPFANFAMNLSNSISNLLSMVSGGEEPAAADSGDVDASDGFPRWVSAADRRRLLFQPAVRNADIVVAKDGSGNYRSISRALMAAVKQRRRRRIGAGEAPARFVIYVRGGVYEEEVRVTAEMENIMMVGDGIGATVVTGSKNVVDGSNTFDSATFGIDGDGFIAKDMTFRNTAGPSKMQAVALRSGSDRSVFYRCSIEGYQDTLYVHSQRQLYRECDVYGTVDFIFGDAAVVLQDCNIYVRRPMRGQRCIVTAQGRTDRNENTAISIQGSRITAAPEEKKNNMSPSLSTSFEAFLGRPWKKYSRTVFMESYMDGMIAAAGWMTWRGGFGLSTLYYGEYMNRGPGSATAGRVRWPGHHVITSADVASRFTAGGLLSGSKWIPAAGVPFTAGL